MQTRRTMMALSAAGLASACASLHTPDPRNRLPAVRVAQERLIRIDVGLRPYRPSGFRVAREALGDKALIHNYGHGGGGITLSWGTAKLALDLGYDSNVREYAVLGGGAVGLATARLLQERGAKVRIYARELPPNTTSNVAGAQWWPASVYDHDVATPEFIVQHTEAARFAFRRFQSLVGDAYGVSWETNYNLSARPITSYPAHENDPMRQFAINQRDLAPHEHNFPRPFVRQFDTMMIETPLYLRRMEADVRLSGAEIVVRAFSNAAELQALPERVIFNCTGLGAGALFGDTQITPARGQLAILLPQPEIAYNTIAREGYMFGRRDGIVLGGTFERGEWSLEPDPTAIAGIIAGHQSIFGAMA
jgi:glycine/D-amino acid oxidase-like deaminating enzyme